MGLFTKKRSASGPLTKLVKEPPGESAVSSSRSAKAPPAGPSIPTSTSDISMSHSRRPGAPRGILRKPSAHFPTFDETDRKRQKDRRASAPIAGSRKQYSSDRARFASLPTDNIASTNDNLHPKLASSSSSPIRKPQGEHVSKEPEHERRESFVAASAIVRPERVPWSCYQLQTLDFEVLATPRTDTSKRARYKMDHPETQPKVGVHVPRPSLVPTEQDMTQIEPFPFPDLELVMKSLKQALKKEGRRIEDFLEVDDIIEGKCWDTTEVDGLKDNSKLLDRKHRIQTAERRWREMERQYHVFGSPLKNVSKRASTMVPVYGYRHQVPLIVVACVEQLYNCGMNHPRLLQTRPDPVHLTELIGQFDQFDPRRALPDLTREPVTMVAALLSTFLSSIGSPLLHRSYFDAIWAWCVTPTIVREHEYRETLRMRRAESHDGEIQSASEEDEDDEMVIGAHGLPSFNSRRQKRRRAEREIERAKRRQIRARNPELARKNRSEARKAKKAQLEHETFVLETPQIAFTRFILMSLSPHTFSFILYVFTFLASLPAHPDNDVRYDMLAEMYAWKMLGGPNRHSSEAMMRWLLSRWWRIVDGFKSAEAKLEGHLFREKQHTAYYEGKPEVMGEPQPIERPSDIALSADGPIHPQRVPHHERQPSGYFARNHPRDPKLKLEEKVIESNDNTAFSKPDFHANPNKPYAPLLSPTREVDPLDTSMMDADVDIPVISPFNNDAIERDALEGDDVQDDAPGESRRKLIDAVSVHSEWAPPQRAAFAAIEDLLEPEGGESGRIPGSNGTSVYSQDVPPPDNAEELSVESLIDAYAEDDDSPVVETKPVEAVEDPAELKRQLQVALEQRDRAQKRLQVMQKTLCDNVLRS
ncbi:unnamed protein product [Somion occarium]|uniref:Rho-GAP domain-containing protein n=1 Tax=Somion occarium TaxID=3059160 RepID=A0ABP1DKQ6_9APHY